MENLTETKLTSEKIYSGCILDFYRDTVRLPNGGTAPRELTRHVGAVCIVPLLDDGRVIVERQFRYPVNEVITEIPAGKRDSRDEAPDGAARRELREETGITARELIPLGPFYPAAAYSDEVIWMYLARGLTFGEQQLDDDEFLNLQAVPLEELARDVLAGRMGGVWAAPHNSTRAFGEEFFVESRFGKCRRTLCTSSFSNRWIGGKAPSYAADD